MWLASLDRRDEALQAFAAWIDEICVTALEKTGRELPAEHAAALALQLAAGTETDEGRPDAPAVGVPKHYLPRAA